MYIALDIGGTNIRIAASLQVENPRLHIVKKVVVTNNYEKDLERITSTIDQMRNGSPLLGIGCGIPGVLSEDRTMLIKAANLSGWVNKEFTRDLKKYFDCNVVLENDDTISALGEANYGIGKNKDFVYITWGTGFGGAEVKQLAGKVIVRQFEAGHQIIQWNDSRSCGCGQEGCAEAYIGGGNIEKYYHKKAHELSPHEWDEVCTYFANTLINVIVFHPTQLVIIGGGIAVNQKEKVEIIREKMNQRLKLYPMPKVCVTGLADNIGLYGSFALLKVI